VAQRRRQVEPDVLGVRPSGARPESGLAGEPVVEVVTERLPARVDVRALLDPVEQVDQRCLRVALAGEAALALTPSSTGTGGKFGLVVPGPMAAAAELGAVSTERLACGVCSRNACTSSPSSPVLSLVRSYVGGDPRLRLWSGCGQAEQFAERGGRDAVRLPRQRTGVGQRPVHTSS
jgi:hypothetical protein